ncbi:MAG: DNA primase [Cardiobacteriaceae bacterium]|nr:DNA primase [Cardiobacteriaceae bacterium]
MSQRINKRFIDQLSAQTDLVALIHARVPLKKKSGDKHWACCPFHEEKSPSFSVDGKKQFYHCFGCGASGDAIRFLMDYSHLSFVESVEELARFNNLSIEYDTNYQAPTPEQKNQQQQSIECLNTAAQWFKEQLTTQSALAARLYLEKRGLKPETLQHFNIGYAPNHNALLEALQKRFSLATLQEVGLIGEKDGRYFDWFRDRIIFPIHNAKGQVVGFGGRALGEAQPKYLNSPETPYFNKRFELYGLYHAMNDRSRPKQLVVTEGYMDVIKLWQHGIPYAVAALGTAIGETHIAQLKKRTSKAYFAFDGDHAGQKAATKALDAIFTQHDDEHDWRFMFMPTGEDPDSLLDKQGLEAFHQLMDSAKTPSQFLIQTLDDGLGERRSVEAQAHLVSNLTEWLSKLPDGAYKKLLTQQTLKAFSLPSDGLILPTQSRPKALAPYTLSYSSRQAKVPQPKDLRLLAIITTHPELSYELQSALYPPELQEHFPHSFALSYTLQQAGAEMERIENYLNHHHLNHELTPLLNTLRELTSEQLRHELLDIPKQTAQRLLSRKKTRIQNEAEQPRSNSQPVIKA